MRKTIAAPLAYEYDAISSCTMLTSEGVVMVPPASTPRLALDQSTVAVVPVRPLML